MISCPENLSLTASTKNIRYSNDLAKYLHFVRPVGHHILDDRFDVSISTVAADRSTTVPKSQAIDKGLISKLPSVRFSRQTRRQTKAVAIFRVIIRLYAGQSWSMVSLNICKST